MPTDLEADEEGWDAWYVTITVADAVETSWQDVGDGPSCTGLSSSFRFWYPRLKSAWYRYLRDAEPCRSALPADAWEINVHRRMLESKLEYIVRFVPETDEDLIVRDYAHRMVMALLGDLPEIPWRRDLLESLRRCRAIGEAGGIDPDDPNAVGRYRQRARTSTARRG